MQMLAEVSMVVDLQAVDPALARLVAAASDHLSSSKILCFELAIIEALTNAVRHGGPRPAGARLDIRLARAKDELAVTIRDATGLAIGPELFDVPAELEPHPLAEGGRGLQIMRNCSDRLAFERRAGVNILEMGFQLEEVMQ